MTALRTDKVKRTTSLNHLIRAIVSAPGSRKGSGGFFASGARFKRTVRPVSSLFERKRGARGLPCPQPSCCCVPGTLERITSSDAAVANSPSARLYPEDVVPKAVPAAINAAQRA